MLNGAFLGLRGLQSGHVDELMVFLMFFRCLRESAWQLRPLPCKSSVRIYTSLRVVRSRNLCKTDSENRSGLRLSAPWPPSILPLSSTTIVHIRENFSLYANKYWYFSSWALPDLLLAPSANLHLFQLWAQEGPKDATICCQSVATVSMYPAHECHNVEENSPWARVSTRRPPPARSLDRRRQSERDHAGWAEMVVKSKEKANPEERKESNTHLGYILWTIRALLPYTHRRPRRRPNRVYADTCSRLPLLSLWERQLIFMWTIRTIQDATICCQSVATVSMYPAHECHNVEENSPWARVSTRRPPPARSLDRRRQSERDHAGWAEMVVKSKEKANPEERKESNTHLGYILWTIRALLPYTHRRPRRRPNRVYADTCSRLPLLSLWERQLIFMWTIRTIHMTTGKRCKRVGCYLEWKKITMTMTMMTSKMKTEDWKLFLRRQPRLYYNRSVGSMKWYLWLKGHLGHFWLRLWIAQFFSADLSWKNFCLWALSWHSWTPIRW